MPELPSIYRAWFRVVERIAPAGVRDEFRREWEAETWSYRTRMETWNRVSRADHLRLAGRLAGAAADASWLRINHWREGILRDVVCGIRQIRRYPASSMLAVLALALGLGVNAALFSGVYALLWAAPPVPEPERVAALFTSDYSGPAYGNSSLPDVEELQKQTRTLSHVSGYMTSGEAVEVAGQIARVEVVLSTPEYFDTLRLTPVAGSVYRPGNEAGAVVSHRFWEQQFAGQYSAIGSAVKINGVAVPVIGVAPRGFEGTSIEMRGAIWMPLSWSYRTHPGLRENLARRDSRGLSVVARLAPGASFEQAASEMKVLAAAFHKEHPQSWSTRTGAGRLLTVVPAMKAQFDPSERGNVEAIASASFAFTGLLLILVCLNLAHLLLARTISRRGEFAVRRSLGAGEGRLTRQLFIENLLLAALGTAAGLLLASAATPAIAQVLAVVAQIPAPELSLNTPAFLFTAGLGILAAILAGIAPALHTGRIDLLTSLRQSANESGMSRQRTGARGYLVAAEVGLSAVLLVAAFLLTDSLARQQSASLGWDTQKQVVARLDLSDVAAQDRAAVPALIEKAVTAAASMPGVEQVALASTVPVAHRLSRRGYQVEGYQYQPGEERGIHILAISPGYLKTVRIPLLRGRDFNSRDTTTSPRVAIVNQEFARRYWKGEDPVGRKLGFPGAVPDITVVGTVADTKFLSVTQSPLPLVYLPFAQSPTWSPVIHVQVHGNVVEHRELLASQLDSVLPRGSVLPARLLSELVGERLDGARLASALTAAFGLLAVLLASLGVYGVMSFAVGQSTREIGLRIALGATRKEVTSMVLARATRLIGTGMLFGLVGAAVAAKQLSPFLYQVRPANPIFYLGAVVVLTAVGLIAAWIPARRAARLDPQAALRTL